MNTPDLIDHNPPTADSLLDNLKVPGSFGAAEGVSALRASKDIPVDDKADPNPIVPPPTKVFTTVSPGSIVRISQTAGHEYRMHPSAAEHTRQGKAMQMVNFLEVVGKAQVCHSCWASELEGNWRLETSLAPLAIKVFPLTMGLPMALAEYDLGVRVYDAVKSKKDEIVVVEPLMVGMLEMLTKESGWTLSGWAVLVMPLHESLPSYLAKNLSSLSSIGLIYFDAIKSLKRLHNCKFFHGDTKADNIVVQQSWKDGVPTSDKHALWIDFGTSWFTEEGKATKAATGTAGFMSLAVLSAYARFEFEPKAKEYRDLWRVPDGPPLLDMFFLESSWAYRSLDDLFGIGVSLLDTLVAHKRAKYDIKETFRLTSDRQINALQEFFRRDDLGPFEDLDAIMRDIAACYRRIWEGREYEQWLGEEYAVFFPVLESCMKKAMWNPFDSSITRQPKLDTVTFKQFKIDLLDMEKQEKEKLAMEEVARTADTSTAKTPASGKAAPKKLSSKTISSASPRAKAGTSLGIFTAIGGRDMSIARATEPLLYGPSIGIPVDLSFPPPTLGDIHLLQQGNSEPFTAGRVVSSKLSHGKRIKSWDCPIGGYITTAKGNRLVPQSDGGYAQEVWMSLAPSGVVTVNPDLFGCGRLSFVCAAPGCGVGGVKARFGERDAYMGHYKTNLPRYRCPAVSSLTDVVVDEVNKAQWRR